MLGWFTYAQNQRLKAARSGPELREILGDYGWNPYGASDPSLLDDVLRWANVLQMPDLPDPLAAEDPDDEALLAVVEDLKRQARERDASRSID
ncbi:MAG: hypothetical protein Rubg2KO_29000 [Rubricoccaceae bacterium]